MTVQHVEDLDQFKNLLSKSSKVVIDFSATWCGPCKAIAPKYEALSNEDKYKEWTFCKVDVDEADDVASEYGVSAMPTFLFFKNGSLVDKFAGANESMLVNKLNML
jgi:thioredoxin 1